MNKQKQCGIRSAPVLCRRPAGCAEGGKSSCAVGAVRVNLPFLQQAGGGCVIWVRAFISSPREEREKQSREGKVGERSQPSRAPWP